MAHNIFEKRFYSLRVPAWHKLGIVADHEQALDEITALLNVPDVTLEPVYAEVHGKNAMLELPDIRAIISSDAKCFGTVSDHYKLVSHKDFLAAWQQCIPTPTETLGMLGQGETLFITTTLPSISVKGDECKPYLFASNTCDGKTSIRARPVATRVVCQNTMNIALREYTNTDFNGRHMGGDVLQRLMIFLTHVWDSRNGNVTMLQDAFTKLAETCVDDQQAKAYHSTVYELPDRPDSSQPEILVKWEEFCLDQVTHRSHALHLFQDSPTNTDATKGTLWGAYQSVLEYECHCRKGSGARSVLFGAGAQRMEKAFTAAISLV